MAHLSAIQAFVLGFCSSGYDFAIASSRPHLTMRTLQVAIGFAGNCAPCGLSPQTNGMPVIPKKACAAFTTAQTFIILLSNLPPPVPRTASDWKALPHCSFRSDGSPLCIRSFAPPLQHSPPSSSSTRGCSAYPMRGSDSADS